MEARGGQEKNCGGYAGKRWVPKASEANFFLLPANFFLILNLSISLIFLSKIINTELKFFISAVLLDIITNNIKLNGYYER